MGPLCSEGVFAGSRPRVVQAGLCLPKAGGNGLYRTRAGSGWTSEEKSLFAEMVIRHWNRLPRAVGQSPFLQVDMAPGGMVY